MLPCAFSQENLCHKLDRHFRTIDTSFKLGLLLEYYKIDRQSNLKFFRKNTYTRILNHNAKKKKKKYRNVAFVFYQANLRVIFDRQFRKIDTLYKAITYCLNITKWFVSQSYNCLRRRVPYTMASCFTIYSINQISDLIYQISYIIYKISDILYQISYIN